MSNPEPTLIATSVVRGSQQGESHGGVYLIDTHSGEIHQTVDWNTCEIDFAGRGWDRGLRGIAFHNEEVYVAASDELFVYEADFRLKRSFRSQPWSGRDVGEIQGEHSSKGKLQRDRQ